MIKPKKTPQRMCVGCREMKSKRELIRVVRSPEGEVSIDFTGKKSGRGAYICPNDICLNKSFKTKALQRALQVNLEGDIVTELRKQVSDGESEE